MCGIAGLVYRTAERTVTRSLLAEMNRWNALRGPDAEGYWCEGRWGLAHRRLSILDLSPRGAQPMATEDGKLQVVFNGEIYNYPELRPQLTQAGYRFRSDSDTEVLLHGYRHWGLAGLLERLRGMFAFALVDVQAGQLLLARDRLGKKPLYYCDTPAGFYFSSDIRSLLPHMPQLRLNYTALDYYLSELCMPQPATIWQGILQLPAAHSLTLDPDSPLPSPLRYWQLDYRARPQGSEEDILQELEHRLSQAVRIRQMADVPLGAFLSGGVDSGLVVAMLARQSAKPVQTFTVGFSYEPVNELPAARRVAERYGTRHTEIILEADIWAELPGLVEHFAEPFADASALPTLLISRAIRQQVTVALSGDGGDELFGGYYEYPRAWWADRLAGWQALPAPLRTLSRAGAALARRLGRSTPPYGLVADWHAQGTAGKLYRQMGYAPRDRSWLRLPAGSGAAEQLLRQAWTQTQGPEELARLFEASMGQRLLNDYLVKVDRASMACSLEVRSPLLDTDLAEYAASLPLAQKLAGGQAKYLLKRLAQRWVDPEVFTRRKQGFSLPLAHWLRTDLREPVSELLHHNQLAEAGMLERGHLQAIWQAHLQQQADHTYRIWAWVCLELWMRAFRPSLA